MLHPKQLLFQLTFVNILIIAAFVGLSSWALYNTACMLANSLVSVERQKQMHFEASLFQYLWIFSISAIIIGSISHFYLTKKVTNPLRKLIVSAKTIKQGEYPNPIQVNTDGEIGELTSHFNDLVLQLKENEQYRRKVVSDLSHEFRTPLSNLSGYLQALHQGAIEGDKKLYLSLYKESKQLIHLIEQMEQLKEWDSVSTKHLIEKSSVQMKDIVDQSMEMFRWSITKANIKFHIEVEPCVIKLNSSGISQVINNLLDNAIRYYEGIETIKIKGRDFQSEYKFSITAKGKRIPLAEQEKIFERFYRVDYSRSREFGGSGLGLAISKEIIEQHYGKIGVVSDEHVHTFWFCLPK
jgi:two-component system, OmpR family, sensor histidine kinase BaeS